MKKDWVVWVCCFLLFCSGVIWGGVPIGIDFFVVNDIHDFFEIVSSAATTIAVCVAAASLNTWRNQIAAENNHDLAKNVLVSLIKYKESALSMWRWTSFAATQVESSSLEYHGEVSVKITSLIKSSLDGAVDARSEIESLALECWVVWGDEFREHFDDILNFENKCSACVGMFLSLPSLDASDVKKDLTCSFIENSWSELASGGVDSYQSAIDYVDRITHQIKVELKDKLIV